MSNPEITHMMARQPVKFVARNFRGRHKRLKAGNIWLAEMEVEREIWDVLDTMPDGAMFEVILWITDGEKTEEQPQEKKQSGPYSEFWSIMFGKRFWLDKSLWHVLEADSLDAESAKQLLHNAFKTTSMSLVSPEVWETWCATHDLQNLFNMSRAAGAKVEAKPS
jgi:hypothetical protein